ncbi:MAG: hypothetical protein M3O46_22155 [Myxococcota bacterium]|nr:hypothetical protein [Myxococcota bacterium]
MLYRRKKQLKTLLLAGAMMFSVSLRTVPARAYTISNILSRGCHENITSDALRAVRAQQLAGAGLIQADANEQALIDDLQFTPDADMNDLGAVTLLLGVRDNDLKGRGSQDLSQLAEVHGDPAGQDEHCLRANDQKEPGGSAAAVANCRAFIHSRVIEALAGLDASGNPDKAKRTTLGVHLALRGYVNASLPTYYVRMGQAIHAIEDSFTHTYRTADERQITVVLDWIDEVNGTLVESRDGPGHATELDRCDDPDELRKTRRVLATAASTEILRATLDPQNKTPDEKLAAADAVLDAYLTYSPGCTFANDWCNAPENRYKNAAGCGCTAARTTEDLGMALPGAALAGVFVARRRRRLRLLSPSKIAQALLLATPFLFQAGSARAQSDTRGGPTQADAGANEPVTRTVMVPPRPATDSSAAKPATVITTTTVPGETPTTPGTTATKVVTPQTTTITLTTPTQPDKHKPPPPTVVPIPEPGPRDVSATAWGAFAGAAGSIENPALVAALGVRLRLNSHWIFGLDGEWNPWLAHGATVRAGVANFYGTGILQFPLAYENFNLRSSLSLGGSYLLMNLYGAPKGSLGLFADISFLGLAWKVSRTFYLITNPVNIAIPVPQLKGVPFTYPQYRFTIGLELYLG